MGTNVSLRRTSTRVVSCMRLMILVGVAASAVTTTSARADLVGYWNLNGNTSDLSGYGNSAQPPYDSTVYYTADRFGNANSAAWFTDGIYAPDSPSLNLQSASGLTVSAWVYLTNDGETGTEFDHGGIVNNYVQSQNGGPDGQFAFNLQASGGTTWGPVLKLTGQNWYQTGSVQASLPLPPQSGWVNVAATFDVKSQVATVYVNGQQKASSILSDVTQIGNLSQGVWIGRGPAWGQTWLKPIDDVRLYNTALSGPEIAKLSSIAPSQSRPSAPAPSFDDPLIRLSRWDGQKWVSVEPGSITSGNVHVLVHGWSNGQLDWVTQQQSQGIFPEIWNDGDYFRDFTDLAKAIACSYGDPTQATILAFSWIDKSATVASISPAAARTSKANADMAGDWLGTALREAGVDSQFSAAGGKVQLIGHSHGALVATKAAIKLNGGSVGVDQLTILDSPEHIPVAGPAGDEVYKDAFNDLGAYLTKLNTGKSPSTTFVDNYYSVFGTPYANIPSVTVNLENTTDHGYPISWYANASRNTTSEGVWWSPLKGSLYQDLYDRYYRDIPTNRLSTDPFVNAHEDRVHRFAALTPLGQEGHVSVVGDAATLSEASPSYWDTLLTVEPGDVAFSFDYQFLDIGDGDQLGVWIDGEAYFFSQGTFAGTDPDFAVIDLTGIDPGVHVLTFALHSYGLPNASIEVSNFELISQAVPEPSSPGALVGIATALIARGRVKRSPRAA